MSKRTWWGARACVHAHTDTHTQAMLTWSVLALSAALWSTLDDPEDSIPEAPAERGRGGVQQEGGAVPPLTEGAGWGEGDQRPAAEAVAGTTPSDKVQTHAKNTLFHYSYNNDLKLICLLNRRKETLTIRQTLDNLRLDLSVDDEDEDQPQQLEETITKVWGPPWKLTWRFVDMELFSQTVSTVSLLQEDVFIPPSGGSTALLVFYQEREENNF